MPLHKNEQTGGMPVLRTFHAGMSIPAHIHPEANEFAYVLSGEWRNQESSTHPARSSSRRSAWRTDRTLRKPKWSA
jgi:quercetin dioxygenase-like cupin family protein